MQTDFSKNLLIILKALLETSVFKLSTNSFSSCPKGKEESLEGYKFTDSDPKIQNFRDVCKDMPIATPPVVTIRQVRLTGRTKKKNDTP
jgi:hypothetical protein